MKNFIKTSGGKTRRPYCTTIMLILAVCLSAYGCSGTPANSNALRSVKLPDSVESIDTGFVNYQKFIEQSTTSDSYVDGIIVSPYYTATAGGTEVYSYSVPMVESEIHSFGYIEATQDMFPLSVTITANYDVTSAVVVPEKLNIEPEVAGNKVTFTITGYESYNVLFNGKYNFNLPYTLFVREYEKIEVPKGYNLIEFKPGLHYVDYIALEDNTMIYLHSGALLMAKQPNMYTEKSVINDHGNRNWQAFFNAAGKSNLIIKGYGVIDFTNTDLHARLPINFSECNNIIIEGITIVNAANWNILTTGCDNIYINNVIIFGYRINSDGIAICNSKNALVENSWIRSGDDLFEVKATKAGVQNTNTGGENITFRNCQAWAEKTRSFGFIQESQMDVSNVLFEDCSSILQVATWNEAMGVFLVIVGDWSTVSNVKFLNCDSYYAEGYIINVSLGPNMWSNTDKIGKIHDITFDGISYSSGGLGVLLKNAGTAEDFYNISFENILKDGAAVTDFNSLPAIFSGPNKNITIK